MNNSFNTQDIELVAKRIRRMLKNVEMGSDVFVRDVTTLVDVLEHVEEIIFREVAECKRK